VFFARVVHNVSGVWQKNARVVHDLVMKSQALKLMISFGQQV
jgi:hypothetical protein